MDVIYPSRAWMHSSSRNPAQYFDLWDFYFDNKINDYASLIQRFGLRDCSRKTIEEKPAGAVRLTDSLLHHLNNNFV